MKLWIVGKTPRDGSPWEFMGVFDDERLAVDACVTPECWVGPAELNVALPVETTEWPASYYPERGGAA